jgi:protein SCO1/2
VGALAHPSDIRKPEGELGGEPMKNLYQGRWMGWWRWPALFVLAGGLLLAACGSGSDEGANAEPDGEQIATATVEGEETSGFYGMVLTTPLRKPSFTLPDTSGVPFDFAAETEGYVTLLYFGYTYCPDICPGNMAMVGTALKNLPADISDRVKFVFVTCDPDRDTPERVRQWLDNFGETIVGLLPESQQVTDGLAQQALGPFWSPITNEDLGGGDYSVSHPAVIIAYTTDNLAHVLYPFGVKMSGWEHDLPILVQEGWTRS